jgi:hypothetical protein
MRITTPSTPTGVFLRKSAGQVENNNEDEKLTVERLEERVTFLTGQPLGTKGAKTVGPSFRPSSGCPRWNPGRQSTDCHRGHIPFFTI